MSKLPGRATRRGKRPSRKGFGNAGIEDNSGLAFRQEDQNDAVSGTHEKSHETASSEPQRSGVEGRSGEIGRGETSRHLNGRPYSHNRQKANIAEEGAKKKRRGKRSNKRSHHPDDQVLRNLRAPVQRVPDAAYTPVPPKPPNSNGLQPATNNKRNAGQDLGHDTGNFAKRNGRGNALRYAKNAASQSAGKSDAAKRNLYAALDLGTNNCRLLIALPQEKGRFRVIDGFSRIVRLGEGLSGSGRLNDEAMDRAISALKICSNKLAGYTIKMQRLIATEACRQAENGELFLQRVHNETDLKLEIINRETEAALAAEGCGALMDRKADAGVLFDIGGGSSELILVNRRLGRKRISDQIVSWTSLPVGVVNLSERHGGELVTRALFKVMVEEVREMLAAFPGRDELARIWKNGRVHLLGTSGTVTTLAGIHLELPKYDRRRVDGLWLSDLEIDAVLESLLSMNYEQRAASPCVGRERADLVMAGCAILQAIRLTWPSKRLRVADRGLREGILTQLMDRDGAWLRPKRGRWPRRRPARGTNNSTNTPSSGTTNASVRSNDGGHHEH